MEADKRSGWIVVLGCLIGISVSGPALIYAFSIFLKPIAQEFGWTRGQVTLGLSVSQVVAAAGTPLFGVLIDRIGPRAVALIGAVLIGAAIAGFGLLPPIYGVYMALALYAGVASAATSPPSYMSILPQWFDRNLGTAISIAAIGVGIGTIVLPWAYQSLADHGGWRFAAFVMGLAVFAVGAVNNRLLTRENPAYVAARTRRAAAAQDEPILPGATFAEAMRSLDFWRFAIPFFLIAVVTVGCVIHMHALATDRGYTPMQGALALSVVGVASILARLVTGVMLDRFPIGVPATLFFGGGAAAMVMLWLGWPGDNLLVAAFLLGSAAGCEGDMMPYVLRRRFGMRAYGKVYGVMFGIYHLGPIVGPLAMGIAFDRMHTYQPVFPIFLGVIAVALALFLSTPAVWAPPLKHEEPAPG